MSTMIVIGAGPVGRTITEQLAAAGHEVRLLTRSGSGPDLAGVTKMKVDAADHDQLAIATAGATVIFHCAHASAYSAQAFAADLPHTEQNVLTVAAELGSVVVFPESLYAYADPTEPMTESSPRTATTGKRGVRTALLAARAASATPTVSVVASDFYGPYATTAHAGERMLTAVLGGKRLLAMGSADQPHSFTYVPDLAAAMITAAARPDLWDNDQHDAVLHAPTGPALTQREMATAYATAAGLATPRVGTLPGWLVRMFGRVHAPTREMAEMIYQFEQPFTMDSTRTERLLGLSPTPLDQGAATTVAWWTNRVTDGHAPVATVSSAG